MYSQVSIKKELLEAVEPSNSVFDHVNFNTANWSNINDTLSVIDWNSELTSLSVDQMLSKITSVVGNICEKNCKRKLSSRRRRSKFAYDRRTGMRLGFGKNSGKFYVLQLTLIQYNTAESSYLR